MPYVDKNSSKLEIIKWLRDEAGSQNPEYFKCSKGGGLLLQQVPEEFGEFLDYTRGMSIHSFLELGIGFGHDVLITKHFVNPLLTVAVDNFSYGQDTASIISLLSSNGVSIFNGMTSDFFRQNKQTFDLIFIDADHSYDGVSLDFKNALPLLNNGGAIVFHDIHSFACGGVVKFWGEIRHSLCLEFVKGNTCGIGIWRKP